VPYTNVPADKTDEMDRCVKAVMSKQGYSKERAVAICYTSVVEGQDLGDLLVDANRQTEMVEGRITAAKAGDDFQGRTWEITIIGPKTQGELVSFQGHECILSANRRLYRIDGLRDSVPSWEGIKVYDNHLTDEEFKDRAGMRSVAREWIGTITAPLWDAKERAVKGTLNIVDEALARKLKAAWDQGVLGTVGLSIDTLPIGHRAQYEGRQVDVVEGFNRIISLDLVAEPATGGGFNRLLASQNQQEVEQMDEELRAEIMEMIRAAVAEALAAMNAEDEEPAEEPPAQEAADAQEAEAVETEGEPAQESEEAEDEPPAQEAPAPASEANKRIDLLECKMLLRDKLAASKLPPELAAVVEGAFAGRVFKEAELDKQIKRAKEAHAALDKSGQVSGAGGQRASVRMGMTKEEKAEADFLRLVMGNTAFRALEHIEDDTVKERLPQGYTSWIKNGRERYNTRRISEWAYTLLGGDPFTDQRASEAVTTTTMSSIVKNAVNVMLAADYSKRYQWWDPLVSTEEVDTIDQATLVRVFGLSTLSVVDEGAAYTELAWADEEETAAFVKKGNYVPITIETILRDKVNVIRSVPQRLANSWYNTLSALVAGVFTVNTATGPVLADTGALFNATAATSTGGHANLLTTALSFAAYSAARTAMLKQTDQPLGAGSKLLIEPKFLLVPVDLESTGLQIRNSEYEPGTGDNDVNPFYQKVEVVKVPEWTDTNNWALVADPQMFPAIWLIFLRGRRVPELFTADSELAGSMFTNDTLRYKVRMLTYRFSSSYECAPVSDWRPLHKSNV